MPTFDQLNLELARRIGDPVSAVGNNGARYTSAMRLFALNEGIRRFIAKTAKRGNVAALKEYKERDTQALVNNVLALSSWNGGVAWILDAYNVTDSQRIEPLSPGMEAYTESGAFTFMTASSTNQYYAIDGGDFRLLDGGTTTNDNIRLNYIKQHADLTTGGTILIPSEYHPQIIDLALMVLKENEGTSEAFAQSQVLEQGVERDISG